MTIPGWSDTAPRTVSPLHFLATALRYRIWMLRCGLLGIVVVLLVVLIPPRKWTTATSFMPQPRRMNASNVAGLAAQFGLALPTADPASSPSFYVSLLQSHEILASMVDSSYTYQDNGQPVTRFLADVYRIRTREPGRRREDTIKRLRKDIAASADLKSGLLTLRVRARNQELSLQMTQRLLSLLNRFNLESRQSQAAAERKFTQARMEEIQRDLRAAEDELQGFLVRNRDYRNSPVLTFQQERLAREVTRQQTLYSTLSNAYEQARIEEVRDTPVFTVIDRPELPPRADRLGLALKLPLGLILGAGLGLMLGLVREFGRRAGGLGDPDYLALQSVSREAGTDLRHPGRLLRGLFSPNRSPD